MEENIRSRLRSRGSATSVSDISSADIQNPKPARASKTKSKTKKSSQPKKPQCQTESQYCPTTLEKDNPKLLLCPCEDDSPEANESWWSACIRCQQWWHNKCAGLQETNQENNDFVCVLCYIDSIKSKTVKSKIAEKASSQNQSPSDKQSPKQESVQSSNNIVILDNINDIQDYYNSSRIKSEVNRCKPKLNIQQAYPLPRGGIALHLESPEDTQEALKPWPQAFGSEVTPHKPSRYLAQSKVIVGSVKTHFSEQSIKSDLAQRYPNIGPVAVRRFYHRHTKHPLPLIELTCDNKTGADWINSGVTILGNDYRVEPKRRFRVVRCYHCQSFGHVAKNCRNPAVCCQCGSNHPNMHNCTMPANCANCQSAHPADSKLCPVYSAVVTKLHYSQ